MVDAGSHKIMDVGEVCRARENRQPVRSDKQRQINEAEGRAREIQLIAEATAEGLRPRFGTKKEIKAYKYRRWARMRIDCGR